MPVKQEDFDELEIEGLEADDTSVSDDLGDDDEEVVVDGDKAEASVDDDAIYEELSKKENLTLEDLRRIPGADKHTDEELEAMWNEVNKPPVQRSWKAYKGNELVEDISKLSAEEFLALQIGYPAYGKEQRKAFEELVRNAQLGHYNENLMSTLRQERDATYKRYQDAATELQKVAGTNKKVMHAFEQYSRGNTAPLEKMLQDFAAGLNAEPQEELDDPTVEIEQERAGMQYYYEHIYPAIQGISEYYGIDLATIRTVVDQAIEAEPSEFMNEAKLQHILNVDIPNRLETAGYGPQARKSSGNLPNAELEELRKENARLKAEAGNRVVKGAKGRKPPPGGRGSTPSAGGEIEAGNLENKFTAKEWLQR